MINTILIKPLRYYWYRYNALIAKKRYPLFLFTTVLLSTIPTRYPMRHSNPTILKIVESALVPLIPFHHNHTHMLTKKLALSVSLFPFIIDHLVILLLKIPALNSFFLTLTAATGLPALHHPNSYLVWISSSLMCNGAAAQHLITNQLASKNPVSPHPDTPKHSAAPNPRHPTVRS